MENHQQSPKVRPGQVGPAWERQKGRLPSAKEPPPWLICLCSALQALSFVTLRIVFMIS